jgi:UDP-N-acetylmuramate: L-alanyl-gamma-D-glutamyl-meso-diaminopimelate ligase
MNIHFIAVGGSAMHNLAIALHLKGYHVSGSDDEIFEPARSRLKDYGLLPCKDGWDPSRIHTGLDAVILGMHAKAGNPELERAKELGLKIFSYPEYLFEQSKEKTRIVIAGSHGKTTITAMVLHAIQEAGIEADYMVGAQLEGFEVMVKLSESTRYMVMEGDEYLSSTLDPRPKFHLYRPHIALLSGIAWDHINVFPTYQIYIDQFRLFASLIEKGGALVYCSRDEEVCKIARDAREDIRRIPYGDLKYGVASGGFSLLLPGRLQVPLKVFGQHNIQNIHGAWCICRLIGITDDQFLRAIRTFGGASNRLQKVGGNEHSSVYKDFAHSPSKLRATLNAVRELHPGRKLVACLELHTYSSLSQSFLEQYSGCMDQADLPVVYFNQHALALKKLPPLDPENIRLAFGHPEIRVFSDSKELETFLLEQDYFESDLLLMSSGNFDGLDLAELSARILLA